MCFLAEMRSSVSLQAVPRVYVLKGKLHICFSFNVSHCAKQKVNAQISSCKFFQQISTERAGRTQGGCIRDGRKAASLGLRAGRVRQSHVNVFELSLPIPTLKTEHPPQKTCCEEEMQGIKGNFFKKRIVQTKWKYYYAAHRIYTSLFQSTMGV